MKYSVSNKVLLATLALSLTTPAVIQTVEVKASSNDLFSDVGSNHSAYKEINYLVQKNVINGYTDGSFQPNKTVTRAEFAALVARALDLPSATSSFKDVPKTATMYDGVSKAYQAGIIQGYLDGSFKPNNGVSRQDIAVMIDRALQLKGTYTNTKSLDFSDSSSILGYARNSVQRLYHYGIMGAYQNNVFSGDKVGTRAETAVVIYRLLELVDKGSQSGNNPPASNPTPPVNNSGFTDPELYYYANVDNFKVENGKLLVNNNGKFILPSENIVPNSKILAVAESLLDKDRFTAITYTTDDINRVHVTYANNNLAATIGAKPISYYFNTNKKGANENVANIRLSLSLTYSLYDTKTKTTNSPIFKQKVKDSLIAYFGNIDGPKIYDFINPIREKHYKNPVNSTNPVIETKKIGSITVTCLMAANRMYVDFSY